MVSGPRRTTHRAPAGGLLRRRPATALAASRHRQASPLDGRQDGHQSGAGRRGPVTTDRPLRQHPLLGQMESRGDGAGCQGRYFPATTTMESPKAHLVYPCVFYCRFLFLQMRIANEAAQLDAEAKDRLLTLGGW